jgi:phage-related protein
MVSQQHLPELAPLKPIRWVGAKEEIRALPRPAQREIGFALLQAQLGVKHPCAKPLQGFGGASVLEIVEDHDKETYRAVYTVRFDPVVYVLHAFHKKSKSGIATPKATIALIKERLEAAKEFHHDPPEDLMAEIASHRTALVVHEQKQRDRGLKSGWLIRMRRPG